jgi:transposase-like protein
VSWAIVEKENNDSWDWFWDLLFRDLGVGEGDDWVLISDQQKGILTAVQKSAPNAEHRNCARHIYANWRKKHKKKEWQKNFWACGKAPCVTLFNLAKARLAQHTPAGAKAIMNTYPHRWSRAWFRLGSNCDSVDNNMCETFNKWIVQARFFLIITMLEIIRRKVMVRIQSNRSKALSWNTMRKLNFYITLSGVCHAICNGQD